MDKIEPDDELDLVSEVGDAIADARPEIAVRYALRRLVHYGPQPEFGEHLLAAAEAAELCLQRSKSEKAERSIAPGDLEALIAALVGFARELPASDDSIALDVAKFEGKSLRRREGVAAALAFLRAKSDETANPIAVRAGTRKEAFHLLLAEKDYPGAAAELRELEAIDRQKTGSYTALRGVYVNLLINDSNEAFRWMERVEKEEDGDSFGLSNESLKKEFAALLRDRSAARQWWQQTSSWWNEWESLSKKAKLELPTSPGILSVVDWTQPSKMRVEDIISGAKVESASELLWREVTKARWHQSSAESAATLLRKLAPRVSKQLAREFRALADKVSPPRRGRQ